MLLNATMFKQVISHLLKYSIKSLPLFKFQKKICIKYVLVVYVLTKYKKIIFQKI